MRALPTGTATFLFTDIEGSTRLLDALGAEYGTVLQRHHEILRSVIRDRDGVEVGTEGNSFFVVFPSAADAVEAAVQIQHAVGAESWPDGIRVRVRIGVHTGEARLGADSYVGLDVHRAARVMAAAHGGQVLLSDATRTAIDQTLPDGVELRSLGEHRLRDLPGRVRLFQVVAAGLDLQFPPPRTVESIPTNLPDLGSEIIGRDAELAAIHERMTAPNIRILTLVGPGGIGKTRLAVHAAADEVEHFAEGAHFVDLSHARDVEGVFQSIVRAVGLTLAIGDQPLPQAIAEQLRPREALLVLDNFEQVMVAASEIGELVRACPRVKAVVTSREPLRVRAEEVMTIAPLSLPPPRRGTLTASDVAESAAVRLFLDRAQAARPGFALTDDNAAAVAEICARLDGLPLAIELAAARLSLFSADELRDRLRTRLDVLRGGSRDLPDRQRTLRGAIEWSYELLDDDEKTVFRVMSVFESARVDTVEQVLATIGSLPDVDVLSRLASLVDKSLVRSTDDGGRPRLSMLETIREYAAEQLAAEPELATAARRCHAAYFADVAAKAGARLHGSGRDAALDDLADELGNLLAAWRHHVGVNDTARLSGMLDGLWALHEARGWYHGAMSLSNDLLGVLATADPSPEQVDEVIALRLSLARGFMALRGYTEHVEELYRQTLALAAQAGGLPKQFAVLRNLATFHVARGEIDKAAAIGREVLELAERDGDDALQVEGHVILGPALTFLGDAEEGMTHLDRAIELFDPARHGGGRLRLGPSPGVIAMAVSGLFKWLMAYPDSALERCAAAVELAGRINHPYSLAYATFHAALLDLWSGRVAESHRQSADVMAQAQNRDYPLWNAIGLVLHGVTTAALGEAEDGLAMTERGIALYENIRTPPVFWAQVLALKAQACAIAGRPQEALAVVEDGLRIAGPSGNFDTAGLLVFRGDLLGSLGDREGALATLRSAYDEAGPIGARMLQLQAATRLAKLGYPDGLAMLRSVYETITEGFDTPDIREAGAVLHGDPASLRQAPG